MVSKRKRVEAEGDKNIDANLVDTSLSFESLGLDQRLLQAISRQQYVTPTLVQAKAIPLAFEGKDILARAKTGSGKTAAYAIPIIEAIIRAKYNKPNERAIQAIILVPTRELAEQCLKVVNKLTVFCGKLVQGVNIAQNIPDQVQRSLLSECPDIVIGTPYRVLQHIKSSTLPVKSVRHIVVDEADLIMSYGYQEDLENIQKQLPPAVQVFLMSATLTPEVDVIKGLFCRNPAILTLHEGEAEAAADGGTVEQFMVNCSEVDKFLLIYVICKLGLIKGKTIVFVNDVDRCYRVKLFLEQFGMRSCVLNSDFPVNSRLHVLDQFNRNVYNLIIATDEADQIAPEDLVKEEEATTLSTQLSQKRSAKRKLRDREYGVSRGIDFQNVSCVLNFDLPTTSRAYTHRIGRTGRAGNSGMALSFVVPKDQWGKHKASSLDTAKRDEKVMARIQRDQKRNHGGAEIKPYVFDMKQVDAFRYRMDDAFRAVTRTAIREARTKELKQEILASEKLKQHFEENPDELEQLRHDREVHAVRVQHHLKHVPDYLLPEAGRRSLVKDLGFVGIHKTQQNRIRRARAVHKARSNPRRGDPLKTFKVRRNTK
ncbi:P-loop containing nucleoside triphosphate hydrolase protein [Lipomyces kononenkoae]|uniref:P-loop containing nucleoside triphosphate hydrolase protein n=1 Tax=Lipomyces kononenkoae TaxID=34357 RepID=A0ACC3T689_LIPKO